MGGCLLSGGSFKQFVGDSQENIWGNMMTRRTWNKLSKIGEGMYVCMRGYVC